MVDCELLAFLERKARPRESRNAVLRRLLGLPERPDMRRRENKKKPSPKGTKA
jgi:hypothetical protein